MTCRRIIGVGVLLASFVSGAALAQSALDPIVRSIEQGTTADSDEFRRRVSEFNSRRNEQAQLLEQARGERAALEARSEDLETQFDENERLIIEVEEQLDERLGSLSELFGVLQQVAGDARSSFQNSLTNIEYPDRDEWLSEFAEKMGETNKLPSVDEIERLWFELAREAAELGRVKMLPDQRIVTGQGNEEFENVVRVGAFNLVGDGRYLRHDPETNSITELERQPSQPRFVNSTSELVNAPPGGDMVRFGVDITRGQLLELLVRDPGIFSLERVQQGGVVGWIIVGLGILGVLLAIERLITLSVVGGKVRSQLKSDTPKKNNPLGRVLLVYEENKNVDTETLELKLGEAILREQPPLQRGILFIKIISVVAPLLGLLGTVVGMIQTFQAIMLFGAGDASRMAGGISQALVTTMLGLIVAIPMVLLHTIVNGRSRRITQILQEQSAGIVAAQAEKTTA